MKYLKIQFFILLFSVFIVLNSAIYYLYQNNTLIICLSFFVSILITIYLFKDKKPEKIIRINLKPDIWLILFFIHLILSFLLLFSFKQEAALISPWQALPPLFFILYFLSALYLIFHLIKKKASSSLSILALVSFFFLSFSVNIIIFKLGYGFDPFIHQAALEHIRSFNLILPKTPYYIGYYSLVLLINKLLFIAIPLINQMIVPFLSALILPFLFYRYSHKEGLSILLFLLLSFNLFNLSTPSNLAFLFLIITIFLNYKTENKVIPLIASLASIAIHPIAGLPALSFTLLNRLKFRKLILITNLFIFPFIFYFFNQTSISLDNFSFNINKLFYLNQETLILNLIYFWKENAWIFLLVLLIYYSRNLLKDKFIKLSLLSSLSFYLASLISQVFIFTDLISYEQADYSERLKIVALIFMLPAILRIFSYLSLRLKEKSVNLQIIYSLAIALLLSASLYLGYPRLDNYHNSRSFSISSSDLKAVHFIDNKMADPYIVLSNQQLAVSALKELGFNHYLKVGDEEIYFYSIPTGGKLYQYFLETVYQDSSRGPIKKAMSLVNVDHGWLAIHDYWWASDKIVAELKLEADEYYLINDDLHLFYFHLPFLD